MEFFGLCHYGVSEPIKFLMRHDYKEPDTQPSFAQKLKKGVFEHPLHEVLRDLDIYNSDLDGYSYRSFNRLIVHKNKRYNKKIGPKDIYRDPITASMEYGWFINDPALENKTWYKNAINWPMTISEESRFLNTALLQDTTYIM